MCMTASVTVVLELASDLISIWCWTTIDCIPGQEKISIAMIMNHLMTAHQ